MGAGLSSHPSKKSVKELAFLQQYSKLNLKQIGESYEYWLKSDL